MMIADEQDSTNLTMKIRTIIFLVAGAVIGYAGYYFVGCSTGACPLTANPWISTLIGIVFGGVVSRI